MTLYKALGGGWETARFGTALRKVAALERFRDTG